MRGERANPRFMSNAPSSPESPASECSRRRFVRDGAAVLAGATVGLPAWAAATGVPRKVRIGVVGGRFGLTFQFHEHPDCVVEAVSDLRADRRAALQKKYLCAKAYDSLEDLVKDPKVEAVFLATPAPDHARHTLLCLAAGKHVLCAVPVALAIDDCQRVLEAVKRTGLIYMMAETSTWQQLTISARQFYREGAFGNLYSVESEYHHPGLEQLYFENGKRTWRHGLPPMLYPTHCTAHLIGVTGERLTHVSCTGWGDDDPILKDNAFRNPFWNETALFRTNRGNTMRVAIWWRGAQTGGERARYYGDKMSFYFGGPNHTPPCVVRAQTAKENDSGGFVRTRQVVEPYPPVAWWKTDLLPEPLRHDSGHEGSHCFITHEFVDAVLRQRKPEVDVHEALAYTVPGFIAHESALQGGAQLKIPQLG